MPNLSNMLSGLGVGKLKLKSKIMSFKDVKKALQDLEKVVNELYETIHKKSETEVSDKDGKTGDTQATVNADGTYTFEIKTKNGWKTPVIGKSVIKFTDKPALISKHQLKTIAEIEAEDTSTGASDAEKTIFDEKDGKFKVSHLTGIPRPDYDSGLVDVANLQTTGTHSLDAIPVFQQVWWSDDDGVTVHRTYSSGSNSYTLELTTTTWQITGHTYYGSVCLNGLGGGGSGSTLGSIDYTGWKVKVLLWK